MAFPVVEQVVENSTTSAGTSHIINLPTATAGQLLLIVLDKGSTAASINAHGSLTELLDEAVANGLYIAYRWMDGTEPASYTLVSSASTRTASMAYRISGAENPATQAPQIGTTATGSSATPDPPVSVTPGSSKDFLFIAFYGAAGEEADDDTWSDTPPTSYSPSPPRQKACGVAGTNLGGLIAAAERALTTGSAENPGTFAKDVSAAWRAQTITVHPVSIINADAEVSWAEVEAPLASSDSEVAWAEVEVPTADAAAQVAWAELEAPSANADAEVAWAEAEIPSATVNADAEVSWAELEAPTSADAEIAWAETEIPTASSQAQVSWTEVEVPTADARAEIAWAEVQIPTVDAASQIAWATLELPTADAAAQVSWSELEVPTAGGVLKIWTGSGWVRIT